MGLDLGPVIDCTFGPNLVRVPLPTRLSCFPRRVRIHKAKPECSSSSQPPIHKAKPDTNTKPPPPPPPPPPPRERGPASDSPPPSPASAGAAPPARSPRAPPRPLGFAALRRPHRERPLRSRSQLGFHRRQRRKRRVQRDGMLIMDFSFFGFVFLLVFCSC